MKKHVLLSLFSGLAILLPPGVQAQLNSNLVFIPGKLAVYRGGDGLVSFAAKDRQFPAYIDEYDPAITNQGSPILTVPLPTNSPTASMWFNLHAGSEGQGITRSADRQYLALTGYTSPINEALGTPSSATNGDGTPSFYRGFGTLDAFTNLNVEYSDLYDWYGLPPGVTQDNPRGIATDGTNSFWGAGTVAGTQSGGDVELSGTLFRNSSVNEGVPVAIQSIVQSSDFVKIINNVLYMVCQTGTGGALNNGIYTFSDIPGNPMPLPWLPGTEQVTADTNLYLNFGSYGNILTFDMDPSNTTVYAADNDFGIVKFVNNGGVWTTAYVFGPTNIGTTAQTAAGNQGCFGITVDFSYTTTNYPVIYATTMEAGDSSGDVTSNRLISIVDTGNPGTNMVAQTLARANGPNEGFRGLDFTPDLRPLITTQPVNVSTTTNTLASFSVSASSVYPLSYQWQFNGTNVSNNSNYPIITGATTNILNFHDAQLTNQGNYTVIVTNLYGAVTSSVAILTVTATAVPPSLTNAVEHLTNYIGDTVTISATPKGTDPFTYQWYFNNNPLSDDGVKYSGSTNSTLTITNVQYEVDSGNYSIAITNDAGQISNLVTVLTVEYQAPFIGSGGEPES
ncbi:MAG: immunoglobulin domain-containing protein, partial [Verrucomicrobiota bacterium]